VGSGVPLLMGGCGWLLTFLVLDYLFCAILVWEKVSEEEGRSSSFAHLGR